MIKAALARLDQPIVVLGDSITEMGSFQRRSTVIRSSMLVLVVLPSVILSGSLRGFWTALNLRFGRSPRRERRRIDLSPRGLYRAPLTTKGDLPEAPRLRRNAPCRFGLDQQADQSGGGSQCRAIYRNAGACRRDIAGSHSSKRGRTRGMDCWPCRFNHCFGRLDAQVKNRA